MNTESMEIKRDIIEDSMIRMVNKHAEEARKQRRIEAAEAEVNKIHEAQRVKKAKKMARMNMVMNIAKYTFMAASIALFAWMFISWINVISHNTQPGGYDLIWNWNFFKVFFGK
jgi:hypothetical protein